ncbi:MAG: IPT/TIG domain-containing protein [Terracidiphilus sp.]
MRISFSHPPPAKALPVFALFCMALLLLAPSALAGGPKYVAGTSYFNPGVLGAPVHWSGGQVNYYVDQGPLSASVTNQQATAMVDAEAALWSSVPTAAITLTDMGQLNEDVSSANLVVGAASFTVTNEQISQAGQIIQPADVTPAATTYPLGIVYDADGSITAALFGPEASSPSSCQNNGVSVWLDNINANATIAHAIILLNGLCAVNPNQLAMMSFQIERAFGRILGLDYAQVNPGGDQNGEPSGWPVMQPLSGLCGPAGGLCIPNPATLSYDDIAALNRIYPITQQNLAAFPGKQLTAANTVSIQGTVTFRNGVGMQGVNVVARPLDANGNPLYQYTVTTVSGATFNGNHGNLITGFNDSNGNPLTMWGSNDPTLQGFFDLSDIPLPPGASTANYQVTFEAIDPRYILTASVGPYLDGQVTPSGTLQSIAVTSMSAGSSQTLSVNAADSAAGGFQDAIGNQAAPRTLPASGLYCGRLSQIGQADWFTFPVRGNRTFTIVTQALDETGAPTQTKAMPAIGIWDAFNSIGASPSRATRGMNGLATGESFLQVSSVGSDVVRIGIADQRGDGRPDYVYDGWVLYADTVQPARLPATGGPIVIHGMGFRLADTIQVGGRPAQVTSISPNEITAIAPPTATGVTGSVDVEVDDLPTFSAAAIISGGISYDSETGDALTLNTAPANTVPIGEPVPFAVTALASNQAPASGVTVLYTVTSGTATLSCGLPTCSVVATGDGRATINVTAVDGTWSIVTASLTNGSSLQAHFAGGTPPVLASLTPQLSLAAGATFTWTVRTLVLSNGLPISGQTIIWKSPSSGIVSLGSPVALTAANGIATSTLTVGPLVPGQTATVNACLNGTNQCVSYTAFGSRPEYAFLHAVAGTAQSLSVQGTPAQVTLRLLDMDANPMAGGSVTLYQAIYAWAPPCAPHGVCAPSPLLATQTAIATSATDGTVTFAPVSLPGVATNLQALAASGNTSTVSIAIEQHP